jgi:hypothetical protein
MNYFQGLLMSYKKLIVYIPNLSMFITNPSQNFIKKYYKVENGSLASYKTNVLLCNSTPYINSDHSYITKDRIIKDSFYYYKNEKIEGKELLKKLELRYYITFFDVIGENWCIFECYVKKLSQPEKVFSHIFIKNKKYSLIPYNHYKEIIFPKNKMEEIWKELK